MTTHNFFERCRAGTIYEGKRLRALSGKRELQPLGFSSAELVADYIP